MTLVSPLDNPTLALFDPSLLRPPMSAPPRLARRGSLTSSTNGMRSSNDFAMPPNSKRSREMDDDEKAGKDLLRMSRGEFIGTFLTPDPSPNPCLSRHSRPNFDFAPVINSQLFS